MKKQDVLIITLLFIVFFVFYMTTNPHYGDAAAMHHMDMVYRGSPEVPSDLEVATDPSFEVGERVVSRADHMVGMMDGIEVTIVGAFDTVAYATTYTSTNSGMLVENHKWIVREEIVEKGDLEDGMEVQTTAEHMKGMRNAVHTIDYAIPTTVYMVDFELPNGVQVTNHKWVIEEELEAIE
ncbi:DUF1541 domain-containing protein [Aquisalibacillus elongatus]|uniref:Uncharacterized protein DUF1541 n=1 Tax=Aquisalibacillus elongatus TaxID=485577 RepID=A0A3N5CDS0_9BACI|nr:DUF1541 domain-containing protein [Aquisalibacillus elongatus]RPF55281.1 uncharacterized protein DUF1541 [Aquisalibacillus elongatus]